MTDQTGANFSIGEADAGMLRPRPTVMDAEHSLCYGELWCSVVHLAVLDYEKWLAETDKVEVLYVEPKGADAYTAWHFVFCSRLFQDLSVLMPGLDEIREHLALEKQQRIKELEP